MRVLFLLPAALGFTGDNGSGDDEPTLDTVDSRLDRLVRVRGVVHGGHHGPEAGPVNGVHGQHETGGHGGRDAGVVERGGALGGVGVEQTARVTLRVRETHGGRESLASGPVVISTPVVWRYSG